MLGAIYTGLSGMNAYSEGLMMISNNVANLNSPGYKGNFLSFNSMFSQGGSFLGSRNGRTGYGVSLGSGFIDFSQGQLQQSSNPLDLAIQGAGFLTLLNGDNVYYARTGSFAVDRDGFISDAQGNHLAVLNEDGTTSAFDINPFKTSAPVATTLINFADNLSADGDGTTVANIKVFDSLGGEHNWSVKFEKVTTTTPDGETIPDGDHAWKVTVTDANGNEVEGSGMIAFKSDGHIDPDFSTLTMTEDAEGTSPLSVELDFSDVTAFAQGTTNTIHSKTVDGNGMGTLSAVGVTAEGQIELTYSNGKTEKKGFVALTDFDDPQMLQRIGNGLWRDPGRQEARHVASGTNGVGTLMPGELEASNVNLSAEFGQLILIERGFQACSQVVSISNEMIQTLFGMRGQG